MQSTRRPPTLTSNAQLANSNHVARKVQLAITESIFGSAEILIDSSFSPRSLLRRAFKRHAALSPSESVQAARSLGARGGVRTPPLRESVQAPRSALSFGERSSATQAGRQRRWKLGAMFEPPGENSSSVKPARAEPIRWLACRAKASIEFPGR